ncbi:MAG: GtrA family protein, partial [Candidatus Eisenbacteria bacterium]
MRDSTHVQFVRFCLVGVLNTIITYVTFLALFRWLGVQYLAAAGIGYVVGLCHSYLVNRAWTFRGGSDRSGGEIARFILVNAVAAGINVALLQVLVERFQVTPEMGQVPAIAGSLIVNFAGNRLWTFRGWAAPDRSGEGARAGGWRPRPELALLAAAFGASLVLKLSIIGAGGPQTEIDDFSLYEAGFLVWFGNVPPQHGYLESWVAGFSSLATYVLRMVGSGRLDGLLDLNLVANAYRDFYLSPDIYYHMHRGVILAADLLTAGFAYLLARRILGRSMAGYGAVVVCVMYLFTYNTFWSNLRGRPDPLVSLAGVGGVLLYLKSELRFRSASFWLAAVCFGLAAALKLHGIFFALFAGLDIMRRRGWRAGWHGAALMAGIAFVVFLAGDGSLLFDPLTYVKARLETYQADLSLHLPWGNQFIVMLRGSGWLVLPLALAGVVQGLRRRNGQGDGPGRAELRSVTFIAGLWLLLFATIRPLRAYWMLPVLPLFYILAVHTVSRIGPRMVRGAVLGALAVVFAVLSYGEIHQARTVRLDELRQWIRTNIPEDSSFYIVGFSVVRLPQNTDCMRTQRTAYERVMEEDREAGLPFT